MTTEFDGAFLLGRIRHQLMGIDDAAIVRAVETIEAAKAEAKGGVK